jgi:hypothetical protein
MTIEIEKLQKLGLKKAAEKIEKTREFIRKTEIAYKCFRHLTPAKIEKFNELLRKETFKEDKDAYYYKHLNFESWEEYDAVPPESVLSRMEQAIEKDCFDKFEVCTIVQEKKLKDPIVFGVIDNCPDKFFISQWDDDISIDEILAEDVSKAKDK